MKIVCPSCEKVIGTVESVAPLVVTVHCPFDGFDFGMRVLPPEQATLPVAASECNCVGNPNEQWNCPIHGDRMKQPGVATAT